MSCVQGLQKEDELLWGHDKWAHIIWSEIKIYFELNHGPKSQNLIMKVKDSHP